MHYFIDCEFDGFKGPLLSMALVAEDGRELYWTLSPAVAHEPWVLEHVIPVMDDPAPTCFGDLGVLRAELKKLFSWDGAPTLVADWPADIKHFMEVIDLGSGEMLKIPNISAKVIRCDPYDGVPESEHHNRHNALADARRLRSHFRG